MSTDLQERRRVREQRVFLGKKTYLEIYAKKIDPKSKSQNEYRSKIFVSVQINGKEKTKKKIVCEQRVYPKKTYLFTDKMIYTKIRGLCEQRVMRRTREGLCE